MKKELRVFLDSFYSVLHIPQIVIWLSGKLKRWPLLGKPTIVEEYSQPSQAFILKDGEWVKIEALEEFKEGEYSIESDGNGGVRIVRKSKDS